VLAAVLVVGVTAAWAGFPNFRNVESTFDPGSPSSGTTTQFARASAAAMPTAASYSPATFYVRFSATEADPTTTFVPYAEGTQGWACANSHGAFTTTAVSGPFAKQGRALTLASDAHGRIVYRGDGLSVGLTPPASLTCPNGQTALVVRLALAKLVLRVVGETKEQPVRYPTSAGWAGHVYARPGFSG